MLNHMRTKNPIIFIIYIIFLGASLVLSSCKKEDEEEPTPNDNPSTESNRAQSEWDDVLKIAEDAMTDNNDGMAANRTSDLSMSCATITINTVNFDSASVSYEGFITVDFGSNSITPCIDGKIRSGKLKVAFTGQYRTTNTKVTVTTENYYVNGVKVEGTRTVTNSGNNVYNVVDSGLNGGEYATLTYADGSQTTWKSTRTRTWVEGTSTPVVISDDAYLISGTASGLARGGSAYTMVATDVRVSISCWLQYVFVPSSGMISVTTTADGLTRSIKYGDGSCDRNATYVHTNGREFPVVLY
jgi:hypothetical protein